MWLACIAVEGMVIHISADEVFGVMGLLQRWRREGRA